MSRKWLTAEDPRRIGPYWPLARLGAGGQGVVYEAYDSYGVRCAVKVLHSDMAADPFVRERFVKEVRAAQSVASFCTARILAADPYAEVPYIASEFVDGYDLATVVRYSGRLSGDGLLRLATGVATALTAIHAAGVLHRDLKPGNVLIGPDGPRVIDFGIARTRDMTLTVPGRMMGTPGYMAPEVLRGERADDKGDVFAWGALVLFAATGREPFHGENIGEIVVRVTEHHPDLSVLAEPLRSLVGAALSKDPGGRPTATQLLIGLLGDELPADTPVQQRQGELLEAGVRGSAHVRGPGETLAVTAPALGHVAEDVFTAFEPAVQDIAQRVLLRLVAPGDAADGSQDAVRTATFTELTQGLPALEHAAVRRVLDAFTGSEVFLTDGPGAIRPVGAALLRAWPRLRGWVDAHRAQLRTAREVGEAARVWDRGGRNTDDLLRGGTLRSARGWADAAPPVLRPSHVERAFLDAGGVQEGLRRRQQRRVRASLAGVLVLALVAGSVAWRLQRANTEQENMAIARDVASVAESMRLSDPETAMLLSVAAWRIAPVDEARSALLTSMNQRERDDFHDPTTKEYDGTANLPATFRFLSEDGRTLVSTNPSQEDSSARQTESVQRFDVRTGKRLSSREVPADNRMVISPDGRFGADGGVLRDLSSGGRVGNPVEGDIESLSEGGRRAVSQSDDHELIVTDLRDGRVLHRESESAGLRFPISADGSTVLWCGADGRPVVLKLATGSRKKLSLANREFTCLENDSALALSRDGSRVALDTGGPTQVWETTTQAGRTLSVTSSADPQGHEDPDLYLGEGERRAVFSPDGSVLALASATRVVAVRSTDVNETIAVADASSTGGVTPMPVAVDSDARVLRFETHARVRTLDLGPVLDVPRSRTQADSGAFTPDARNLIRLEEESAESGSTRLRSWRLPAPGPGDAARAEPQAELPSTIVFWPDGLAFRPDGTEFAASDGNNDIALYDTRTGQRRYVLPDARTDAPASGALAFGTDGRTLAVTRGSDIEIWDTVERRRERTVKDVEAGLFIALGGEGDSRVLVTSDGDRVDVSTGKVTRNALGDGELADMEFSPDGTVLAVSGDDGVSLWDGTATTRLGALGSTSADHAAAQGTGTAVTGLRFSPDGRSLAAVVDREGYQLWDVVSRRPVGGVQPGIEDRLAGLAFDEDGRLHLTGGRVLNHVVDTDPKHMARTICERVHRAPNLTREEWEQNVREADYRAVCEE